MMIPPIINTAFFAPCGMNCMVCYKHCYVKKTCASCLPGDDGKPDMVANARLKTALGKKGLNYCFACVSFPYKLIQNLEKSHNQRYSASLVQNGLFVKEHGLAVFMEQQLETYTCPNCGGVISLHDAECSEWQTKAK